MTAWVGQITNLICQWSIPKRIRFKYWLDLESVKENAFTAAERDGDEFPRMILDYLSAAVGFRWLFERMFWEDTIDVLYEVSSRVAPKENIPLLQHIPPKEKNKAKEDWAYDGRTWYYWSHILVAAYGWSLNYIANLDVNDALRYVQEILTEDQLEKEFQWSLSEVAYPYNKTSKKSEFKPMPRPYWMKPSFATRPVKLIKIRRDLMPIGLVENPSGMTADVIKSKEAKSK